MNHTFRNSIASLFALPLVTACSAVSPESISLEERLAKRGYSIGEPVENIRDFRINGWNSVDRGNFMIHAGASRKYLVTVGIRCRGLRTADNLGFSTTVGALTNKDTVVVHSASRGSENCSISTIHLLEKIDGADDGC